MEGRKGALRTRPAFLREPSLAAPLLATSGRENGTGLEGLGAAEGKNVPAREALELSRPCRAGPRGCE